MPAKQLLFDESARQALLRGVQKLNNAVKTTLGPRAATWSSVENIGFPTVTKDGVTVAKEIELNDAYENMGAQMVREVASKTSDDAGDGTTTATLLAEAIYREGLKFVDGGRESDRHSARHSKSRSRGGGASRPDREAGERKGRDQAGRDRFC